MVVGSETKSAAVSAASVLMYDANLCSPAGSTDGSTDGSTATTAGGVSTAGNLPSEEDTGSMSSATIVSASILFVVLSFLLLA